jgi:hypothetical protein
MPASTYQLGGVCTSPSRSLRGGSEPAVIPFVSHVREERRCRCCGRAVSAALPESIDETSPKQEVAGRSNEGLCLGSWARQTDVPEQMPNSLRGSAGCY